MLDLTYTPELPAGPDYPIGGKPHSSRMSAGDGTEGPEAPVTPAPEPPGYPRVPELPDDSDERPPASGDEIEPREPGI
jgi:hypothetical protein